MLLSNIYIRTIILGVLSFVILSYYNSYIIVENLKVNTSFVNIDNISIAYKEFGKENSDFGTVVFLHGFPGSSSDWEFIIQNISKNYHCITIDIPPFGLSEKSKFFNYSDENIVKTLIIVLDKIGVKKFSLVGHSMGGYLSILIANDIPDRIEKLILIDSAHNLLEERFTVPGLERESSVVIFFSSEDLSKLLDIGLKLYPLVKPVYYSSLRESATLSENHFEKLFSQNFFLPGEVLVKFASDKFIQNYIPKVGFSKFTFPVLIIYGEQDTVTPPKIGESLHSKLPNSEFILIPKEGHMPLFNDLTIKIIKEFLKKGIEQ